MKRVLRILEYVGTAEKIQDTLDRNGIPTIGTKYISKDLSIKSGLVGIGFDDIKDSDIDNTLKALNKIHELIGSIEDITIKDKLYDILKIFQSK